jgi:hypothetical protein
MVRRLPAFDKSPWFTNPAHCKFDPLPTLHLSCIPPLARPTEKLRAQLVDEAEKGRISAGSLTLGAPVSSPASGLRYETCKTRSADTLPSSPLPPFPPSLSPVPLHRPLLSNNPSPGPPSALPLTSASKSSTPSTNRRTKRATPPPAASSASSPPPPAAGPSSCSSWRAPPTW